MKKLIKILIPVIIFVGGFFTTENSGETDKIIIKKYKNVKGLWQTDKKTYKYKLVLTGKPPKAEESVNFVVLSDQRNITFRDVSDDIFGQGKKDKEYILAEIWK